MVCDGHAYRGIIHLLFCMQLPGHPLGAPLPARPIGETIAGHIEGISFFHVAACCTVQTGTDFSPSLDGLPPELLLLLDPSAPVQLPPPQPSAEGGSRWGDWHLDTWKLDKLVSQLGRSKATWRRALLLFEWLKSAGYAMDDRLCTTVRGGGPAPAL